MCSLEKSTFAVGVMHILFSFQETSRPCPLKRIERCNGTANNISTKSFDNLYVATFERYSIEIGALKTLRESIASLQRSLHVIYGLLLIIWYQERSETACQICSDVRIKGLFRSLKQKTATTIVLLIIVTGEALRILHYGRVFNIHTTFRGLKIIAK